MRKVDNLRSQLMLSIEEKREFIEVVDNFLEQEEYEGHRAQILVGLVRLSGGSDQIGASSDVGASLGAFPLGRPRDHHGQVR